jgi:hypothetical protein
MIEHGSNYLKWSNCLSDIDSAGLSSVSILPPPPPPPDDPARFETLSVCCWAGTYPVPYMSFL